MRRAAKVDRNHGDIVAAFRACGCTVQSLAMVGKGCPDLLVGIDRLPVHVSTTGSANLVVEVKPGDVSASRKRLTVDEMRWHAAWRGQVCVIESAEEAVALVVSLREGAV